MKVFAIRPEPGQSDTIRAGRERGLDMHGAPLFAVEPVEWDAPEPAGIDGILLGSANALRHAGADLTILAGKPVYAVGGRTAALAAEAGLPIAHVGSGGLQDLLEELPHTPLKLLRLAGREHVSLDTPDHIELITRIVYAAEPLTMPAELAEELDKGGLILVHSSSAAKHFFQSCERLAVDISRLEPILIGPRLTRAIGEGWGAIHIAAEPNDDAMLAKAEELCQKA